ncbi:MAG: thioesterase family protein [Dehalococcoidia bacterium]|nr:thioesterase family protein [Dehalococcoidia bacterium]
MGKSFETQIRVRFADTDADGGVYFANYLTYFAQARHELFREVNIDLGRLAQEYGLRMLSVETSCRYRAMAYFDDPLTVRVLVERLGNTSMTFSFEILRPDGEGQTLLATGSMALVVVDRQTNPVTMPPWIRDHLSSVAI